MTKDAMILLYGGVQPLTKLPLGWRWCRVEVGRKYVHVHYRGRHVKIARDMWPVWFPKVDLDKWGLYLARDATS